MFSFPCDGINHNDLEVGSTVPSFPPYFNAMSERIQFVYNYYAQKKVFK